MVCSALIDRSVAFNVSEYINSNHIVYIIYFIVIIYSNHVLFVCIYVYYSISKYYVWNIKHIHSLGLMKLVIIMQWLVMTLGV